MRSRSPVAAGVVFCSGACALIYQTTWLREFRLIFGGTTAASAAVIGIFMGGLGFGSLLFGKRAERSPFPLSFYARLELLIALSAAVTPLLLKVSRWAFLATGGTTTLGEIGATVVRLLLALLVIGCPVLLMGGTLPAIARFAVAEHDGGRRGLALLYGTNTLGAVCGAVCSTFFLFERLGNHATLWTACGLNIAVAMFATLVARREKPAAAPVVEQGEVAEAAAPYRLVLAAAAITGFVFLLMELIWFRMLAPILGGTAYTFGLIVAVALLGIGLGGIAYALLVHRRPTLGWFALTCAAEALCVALPYALGDRLAVLSMLLQPLGTLGLIGRVLAWSMIASVVVLPAAIIAGIQFPMLVGLLGRGREEIAAQTGAAYAWNTAGAIAGSLAGGFGLIPMLSAPGAWRFVVYMLAGCAAVAAALAQGRKRSMVSGSVSIGTALASICAVVFATGPTSLWRHGGIGIGNLRHYEASTNQLRDMEREVQRDILWEKDGRESSIGISKSNSLAFVVNGKCDGNIRGDAGTQVMPGLLSLLANPKAKTAAVVGLGTGSSAGWLAAAPAIARVDVFELEPAIVRFTRDCAAGNQNALDNPKLHLNFGDARESLLTHKQNYDIVVSEPSNPYRAGVATLFTREYYQTIASKLSQDGVFAQWMQTYDVDRRTIEIFYATFSSVFPNVETWQTMKGDLLLIGSRAPVHYDLAKLRNSIGEEPFRSAFRSVWHCDSAEGVFAHYIGNSRFVRIARQSKDTPLNTDDRTILEFAFARGLSPATMSPLMELRRNSHLFGTDKPDVDGALDWNRVNDERLGMFALDGDAPGVDEWMSTDQRLLAQAFQAYVRDDLLTTYQCWRQLKREPRSINELIVAAESFADRVDSAAVKYIQALSEIDPVDAKCIEARLLWRQSRNAEAATLLEKAFAQLRTDVWADRELTARALKLAEQLGGKDQKIAASLYRALEAPFCLRNNEEQRLMAQVNLGIAADFGQANDYTLHAIEKFEPYVPWQPAFLKLRADVYAHADHALRDQAERDLATWNLNDPTGQPLAPFTSGARVTSR